ncbi:MAG: DUF5069 domain-containing protein [Lentimonas sp.]
MSHYTYQKRLKSIWTAAVEKYRSGHRKPEGFFDEATLAELATFGLNVMDVFDYAEDYVDEETPDFETFLMICEARRDYFLTIQEGTLSDKRLDSSTLPPKDSEMRGIVWLPRIIPKAIAKLKGELPHETMYCCGGDRYFLSTNDIHPAEFLRVVWAYEDEPEKIADWVEARFQSKK